MLRTIRNIPISLIFLICLISLINTACKKFLEIPPPKTELETFNTFSEGTTANAAILGIYSKMINDRGFTYTISLLSGLSSDELKNYSTNSDIVTFYANNLNSRNSLISLELWNPAYNFIYNANSILEGISTSTLTDQVKKDLSGEAKFTRAFWYFYLVNLFGDVPLITSTEYNTNALISRTQALQVYQQIISDLKDAQNQLGDNYVGVDGVTISSERVRPNRWAATALLARAYLYANDSVNAETESSKLINNPAIFSLVPDPSNVFLKNSEETIWALQPAPSGTFSTPEGVNYILTSKPATGGNNRIATISPTLLNAFEANDSRKTKWVGTYTSYMFPNKYKQRSGTSLTEYSVVLRLGEQYLIRAEARARQNKIAEGLQDLNKIRNRAGLNDTTATNKNELLDLIFHERQVELFSEYGHRWLDLKRTGKIEQVMTTVASQKGATWSSFKKLFPIPQKELDADPKLTQNIGY